MRVLIVGRLLATNRRRTAVRRRWRVPSVAPAFKTRPADALRVRRRLLTRRGFDADTRTIDRRQSCGRGRKVTYKGLPAPIICDWRTREESRVIYDGAEFQIGKVEMVANTGT